MWIMANPNPCRLETEDCVVRAIAIALGKTWKQVHWDLCIKSHEECTMPSVNRLWGDYLRENGFKQFLLPKGCPGCVTVREFCELYPKGVYVVGTGHHAVAVIDGNYLDAWDSGDEQLSYFWKER